MIGKYTPLDAIFVIFFLTLFPILHPGYGWIGVVIGALLILRILKDVLPPPDKIVFLPKEDDQKTVQERNDPFEHPPPPV